MDKFVNGKVHFLDLDISICVFRQITHTGQYTNFHDSFEPWSRKTAWIKSLFCRAVRICSNTFFLSRQISTISKFMAWNGFPANSRWAILRKLKSKHNGNDPPPCSNTSSGNNSYNIADENISKTWVRIPFLGKPGGYLVKKPIRKLQRNLTKPVKFIVIYQTKKVSYFLSKKDKINPDLERNDLVYDVCCSATYIGKTARNLRTRLTEHAKLNCLREKDI